MSDSNDRIRRLRIAVSEIERILTSYGRKSEGTETAHKRVGGVVSWIRVAKMIRFAEEREHIALVGNVRNLTEELNKLESDIEDEISDERDANRWYDEENDE